MAEGRSPRHVRSAKKSAARKKSRAKASAPELVSGRARLQKILAAAGLGSRRATEEFLRDGRVTVNGETAQLGDSADPALDVIAVDGEKLGMQRPSYWILNKPVGVVTTMNDPENRPTVANMLPPRAFGVFPVGRLDVETTGLVLMTNDGTMAQTLLHPATGGEKEYRVVLKGPLKPNDVIRLQRGMLLEDGRTKPTRVDEMSYDADRGVTNMKLVLTEGRNRQIRRMMFAIGRPVKSLSRTRVGPIKIGKLRRGEARPLRPNEVAALKAYVERLRAGDVPKLVPGPTPARVSEASGMSGARGGQKSAGTSNRSGRPSAKSRAKGARKARAKGAKSAGKKRAKGARAAGKKTAGKRAAGKTRAKAAKKGARSGKPQTRVARKGVSKKKASSRPRRK